MTLIPFRQPLAGAEPAAGRAAASAQPAAQPASVPISAQQYVHHLTTVTERETLAKAAGKLDEIEHAEIKRLIDHSADLKSRYFVALLDLPTEKVAPAAALQALKSAREAFEEIDRGVELVKKAIIEGGLRVKGIRQPS